MAHYHTHPTPSGSHSRQPPSQPLPLPLTPQNHCFLHPPAALPHPQHPPIRLQIENIIKNQTTRHTLTLNLKPTDTHLPLT